MDNLKNHHPHEIRLSSDQWIQLIQDVSEREPEEACGLIAGKNGKVKEIYPITNILHSKVRFRMDPEEQIRTIIEIEKKGWELLAIYHSHPKGPKFPSHTDIEEAYYPEVAYIILVGDDRRWSCRGFIIKEKQIHEIPVFISNSKSKSI